VTFYLCVFWDILGMYLRNDIIASATMGVLILGCCPLYSYCTVLYRRKHLCFLFVMTSIVDVLVIYSDSCYRYWTCWYTPSHVRSSYPTTSTSDLTISTSLTTTTAPASSANQFYILWEYSNSPFRILATYQQLYPLSPSRLNGSASRS